MTTHSQQCAALWRVENYKPPGWTALISIDDAYSVMKYSKQGTCGGIFCVKVTLYIGPPMNVCMYYMCSPVVVCPFMHAKYLTLPDHHHSPTRPL